MKNSLFIFLAAQVLVWGQTATGAEPAKDRQQFCENIEDPSYFKELAASEKNLTPFRNQGGLFGKGVCWWHSRLQRSALYLTVYKPNQSKPSRRQVQEILANLKTNNNVVEIPGYSNWAEFASNWQPEIQSFLNRWQLTDGFIKQQWLVGISGPTKVSAKAMYRTLKRIAHEVNELNRITYLKLQLPGIAAHSWLVTNVSEGRFGIELTFIDSTRPNTPLVFEYPYGVTSVLPWRTDGVPYIHLQRDFVHINHAINWYCGKEPESLPVAPDIPKDSFSEIALMP